jgi:hypothetical protein
LLFTFKNNYYPAKYNYLTGKNDCIDTIGSKFKVQSLKFKVQNLKIQNFVQLIPIPGLTRFEIFREDNGRMSLISPMMAYEYSDNKSKVMKGWEQGRDSTI